MMGTNPYWSTVHSLVSVSSMSKDLVFPLWSWEEEATQSEMLQGAGKWRVCTVRTGESGDMYT